MREGRKARSRDGGGIHPPATHLVTILTWAPKWSRRTRQPNGALGTVTTSGAKRPFFTLRGRSGKLRLRDRSPSASPVLLPPQPRRLGVPSLSPHPLLTGTPFSPAGPCGPWGPGLPGGPPGPPDPEGPFSPGDPWEEEKERGGQPQAGMGKGRQESPTLTLPLTLKPIIPGQKRRPGPGRERDGGD